MTLPRPIHAVPWKALVGFLAIGFLTSEGGTGVSAAAEEAVELQSPHFRLGVPAAHRRLGEQILEIAESARQAVLDRMPQAMNERVGLAWCATESDFYGRLGEPHGHWLAAAVPSMGRIYLNGPQLQRLDRARFHQALVHEFVHVYLGRVLHDPIPLWLNEGLAMVVAGQWDLGDAAALAADSLFGALLPAERLADRFPREPAAQARAYRQSYSMTAFLLDLRYPTGGVSGLIADLATSAGQSAIQPLLNDPRWVADFDRLWRRKWVRPGRITLILTSSGIFWILVTGLLMVAYMHKRRTRKRREARWALEEEFTYHDDGFDD